MIKLTQRTLNIIDLLVRHSFHYWIWTFCALLIIFDKILHMPLDLLLNFNFIPEFMINLSKMFNTKPIETTIPEITVLPSNNEELIAVIKDSFSLLHQDISLLNTKINSLYILFEKNTALLQNQLNFHKDLFKMVEQKLTTLNTSTELVKINYKLQDLSVILQAQAETQVEVGSRIISHIKDAKTSILTLNNNALDINKNIANLDILNPLNRMQESLNQVVVNQKDVLEVYQTGQEVTLHSINSILEVEQLNFSTTQEQITQIFSKVHEVRNHNLEIYRQLDKTLDFKLESMESKIITELTEEINRPKTSVTQAIAKSGSWSNIFDKKN